MYAFMTLNDGTEIVHSEKKADGRVKVYLEKPDAETGFRHAVCWLPEYRWEDVSGFTEREIERYSDIIVSEAHLIMEFSEEGGFEGSAAVV